MMHALCIACRIYFATLCYIIKYIKVRIEFVQQIYILMRFYLSAKLLYAMVKMSLKGFLLLSIIGLYSVLYNEYKLLHCHIFG